MTPTHHIKSPSTFMEGQNLASSLSASSSSSSSSSSSHAFFSSDQDPGSGPCHHQELQSPQLQSEDDKLVEHQEVRDQLASPDNYGRDATRFNLSQKKEERSEDREDHNDRNSPKLLPTKIRIVRKMMSSSQASGNPTAMNSAQKFEVQKQPLLPSCNSDSSNKGSSRGSTDNAVRVCSDCNTTKTPLWRSGPSGPKSLCNACGIRQRKARRALAAAAAAAGGAILSPATSSVKVKVKTKTKRSKNKRGDDPRLERRCKSKLSPDSSPTKTSDLGHTDFSSRILGKHYSAYQRVFPQDEREAAILLMALSYGLVHG